MAKEVIIPSGAAVPKFPYSPGIKCGNMLFTAGQVAFNEKGEMVGRGDIVTQVRQTLDNIKRILEAGGFTLDDVVKTTVFITDLRHYDKMNEVYKEYFKSSRPARSTVKAELAVEGLLVEIEAVAMKA